MLLEKKKEVTPTRDGYLMAFMMLLVLGKNRSNGLGFGGLRKDVEKELKALDIVDDSGEVIEPDDEQRKAWRDLARAYIESCLSAGNNYGTIFGLIRRKDSSVAYRMAEDFDAVTRKAPEAAGFEDKVKEFKKEVFSVFMSEVEGGAEYLERAQGR